MVVSQPGGVFRTHTLYNRYSRSGLAVYTGCPRSAARFFRPRINEFEIVLFFLISHTHTLHTHTNTHSHAALKSCSPRDIISAIDSKRSCDM